MPGQRKKGKKLVTFFDWEHNTDKLREIADREGMTLSELLRRLTQEVTEKYGEKYKNYDESN